MYVTKNSRGSRASDLNENRVQRGWLFAPGLTSNWVIEPNPICLVKAWNSTPRLIQGGKALKTPSSPTGSWTWNVGQIRWILGGYPRRAFCVHAQNFLAAPGRFLPKLRPPRVCTPQEHPWAPGRGCLEPPGENAFTVFPTVLHFSMNIR